MAGALFVGRPVATQPLCPVPPRDHERLNCGHREGMTLQWSKADVVKDHRGRKFSESLEGCFSSEPLLPIVQDIFLYHILNTGFDGGEERRDVGCGRP